jgi:hypothetical protein
VLDDARKDALLACCDAGIRAGIGDESGHAPHNTQRGA